MTQTFPCPACGAPNEPEAGSIRMTCAYCGANLTIPTPLRTKPKATAANLPPEQKAIPVPEIDAADVIRKAQPIAIGAWNLYARWTWIRWLFPTCLTIFILGCVALGLIPLIWSFVR
ncbi:MAG: hypothetical protein FJ031_05930 [Chloroflexi bacterium]|nr:hypothetical protein [Chloroflexota bacterium]